jgi:hypothetical protein
MTPLVIALALAATVAAAWPPTASNGLFNDVTGDVGLGTNTNLHVAAQADWNNDKSIDLLGFSGGVLSVLLWSSAAHSFSRVDYANVSSDIVSVVVADMDRNGWVDAVASLADGSVVLYLNHGSTEVHVQPLLAKGSTTPGSTINLLDILGDCAQPSIIVAKGNDLHMVDVSRGTTACDGGAVTGATTSHLLARNALPGRTAAVDVNGDCTADIIIATNAGDNTTLYTVSTERPTGALSDDSWPASAVVAPWLTKQRSFRVPSSFGIASWADWNADGVVDVAFPACIHVTPGTASTTLVQCDTPDVFNAFVILPNVAAGAACPNDNCCGGHDWSFADIVIGRPLPDGVSVTDLASRCHVSRLRMVGVPGFPIVLRAGDYNDDRFIDMIIATNNGPIVLHNQAGSGSFDCKPFSEIALSSGGHQEQLVLNTTVPFFFDIDDDGRLDVLTTSAMPGGATVLAYWGSAMANGNYFLTGTTLNGAAGAAWGAIQVGATQRFQFTDINQDIQSAMLTQFPTSSDHALHPPRSHFGLAVTFSYVINYATGMRIHGATAEYKTWPVYLMPNSQVVCLSVPITNPKEWELKLFLFGDRFLDLVLYAWIVALAVIAIPLVVLKSREIRADRKELRKGQ